MMKLFIATAMTAAAMTGDPALAQGPLARAEALAAMIAKGGVVVLDTRLKPAEGPAPFEAGHIPGAIPAPINGPGWHVKRDGVPSMLPDPESGQTFFRALGIDPGETVVLVHDGGKSDLADLYSATRAYWTLKSLGVANLAILDGGLAAWRAAGLPISTEAPPATEPGAVVARLDATWLADRQVVEAAITDPTVLIDSRPAPYFQGEQQHPAARKAGTIPTAINLNAETLVDGTKFKDAAGIAAAFAAVGVAPTDEIVTFCNTAMGCSALWFAAHEVAGFPHIRIYDGSMIDWSQDEARPVVAGD